MKQTEFESMADGWVNQWYFCLDFREAIGSQFNLLTKSKKKHKTTILTPENRYEGVTGHNKANGGVARPYLRNPVAFFSSDNWII